uniref:Uncharacterized protein n=1 Tax=Romanomermis culicivorax TaxID=13658 RepID=A0A915ITG4_ROMCU
MVTWNGSEPTKLATDMDTCQPVKHKPTYFSDQKYGALHDYHMAGLENPGDHVREQNAAQSCVRRNFERCIYHFKLDRPTE